jgi:hypothetical protein
MVEAFTSGLSCERNKPHRENNPLHGDDRASSPADRGKKGEKRPGSMRFGWIWEREKREKNVT